MKTKPGDLHIILIAIGIGLLIGAILPALYQEADLFRGWIITSGILVLVIYCLVKAWLWSNRDRVIAWMMIITFVLRLGLGVFLSFAFPAWGYDSPSQRAGYVTRDAYQRDIEAVNLAQSEKSLLSAFQQGFNTDQYGGMVLISAWIYRYLSPDAHRSYLILILAAFIVSLGVPFLIDAVQKTWSRRIALLAGWIYVFYPDGVFFSSAQMREPFLIGLSAIAFWGVIHLARNRRSAWFALGLSLIGLFLFSSMAGLAVCSFLGIWFWLIWLNQRIPPRVLGVSRSILTWGVVVLLGIMLVLITGSWLQSSIQWDSLVTQQESGWVARLIEGRPGWFKAAFITGYGLTQPVLPGVMVEPTIPLFRGIMIFRSAGWYLIAPLLSYGMIASIRLPAFPDRKAMMIISVSVFIWLIISSIRAGGDQWDNPRYRTIFLVWIAILAGWVIDRLVRVRDPWFWRVVLIEVVFVGFFTNWYVSRYTRIWLRLPFWDMVFWIIGLSVLILAGGWLWDKIRQKRHIKRRFDDPS